MVMAEAGQDTLSIARLMLALQFGDSMLPVGSFSFSNGLESAVQQHVVNDAATLAEYVLTTARRAATSDGIALLAAHRAAGAAELAGIVAADRAVFNRKLGEEMRTMTTRMGRKVGELGTSIAGAPMLGRWLACIIDRQTPGTYPVGLGILFADVGSPEQDAFAVHQYGLAMTTLSAALRLLRIRPHDVQAILVDVNAAAAEHYTEVRAATLGDMAGFAPQADILAAIHVRSHIRIFMT